MVYLEYHKGTRMVVEIHVVKPSVTSDYSYAVSEDFAEGDEFERTIWLNEVDENHNIISYSSNRNNPNARRLLIENNLLKQENMLLKARNQALTERADFIEDVVAEMATQVYQ